MKKNFLITGGSGFIGSSLIRHLINHTNHSVVNIDKLTYASNLESLSYIQESPRYKFVQVDICKANEISEIIKNYQPDIIMHLAAETHVDRSIESPKNFIQTNIVGTYVLLEQAKNYWNGLINKKKDDFRFHHVSTDEVFGDLKNKNSFFTEETPYAPSSPYSASKASSDHLVRAWHRTFKLPIIVTNCSNNYGPFQFPEKLIPLIILNAIEGKNLPIYGNGKQIRDWLYVDDHVRALLCVALKGKIGETYNIGGNCELENIRVVEEICKILDKSIPIKHNKNIQELRLNITSYKDLIVFVQDRVGHDLRYAMDTTKITNELNWKPNETFSTGIKKTVEWYLNNTPWCQQIKRGTYYGERLGVLK